MALSIRVQDCPKVLASQKEVLSAFVRRYTTRLNPRLFSLYMTKIGGEEFLPLLSLRKYTITTIGGAGRFSTINVHVEVEDENVTQEK